MTHKIVATSPFWEWLDFLLCHRLTPSPQMWKHTPTWPGDWLNLVQVTTGRQRHDYLTTITSLWCFTTVNKRYSFRKTHVYVGGCVNNIYIYVYNIFLYEILPLICNRCQLQLKYQSEYQEVFFFIVVLTLTFMKEITQYFLCKIECFPHYQFFYRFIIFIC